MGGTGIDILLGEHGDDVIIGGRNSDLLLGGSGQDLLIGDFTAFDQDEVALLAIRAEWTNPNHNFTTRLANLTGDETNPHVANRLNEDFFLKTQGPLKTVFEDNALDLHFSGFGLDWSLWD